MFTKSFWNEFASIYDYPALDKDIKVDVAIIGAGVTGISTATLLARVGYTVAVLESLKVGGGTSSHSTGNLYFTVDKNLGHLHDKYDKETILNLVKSRAAALDQMETWVKEFSLDCDFNRQPWYLYSGSEVNDKLIDDEFKYAQEAGVSIKWAEKSDFPLNVSKAVKVDGQAQLNPMRYVQELTKSVASDKLQIYECTRVTDVDEDDGQVTIKTTGGTVRAKYAVHATHIPKGVMAVQAALSMYREYGVAFRTEHIDFPPGIFWGYHGEANKYSSRLYQRGGKNM
ncbi:MAG: FAD-binding oxidoreductase [Cyclobacteriaceae bacterium]|nr:FAD-binding oxidoreductase [Cyclobacteriaceae bacterium]